MTKRLITALATTAALSGCASIIKGGGPQAFNVRSQPPGGDVQITSLPDGTVTAVGKTPFTAMLAKSRGFFQGAKYRVVVQMPGYQPREAILDTSVNGWYVAGNLLFGGLIGWLIVDPATGAMWSLDKEFVELPLSPEGAPAPEKLPASTPVSTAEGRSIGVLSLADVPPSARAHLVPLN
jgi:hypothetical protein